MKATSRAALFLVICGAGLVACQRPGGASCSKTCPTSAPYEEVSITTDSTYRYIKTSTCPPYENKNWTNPNDACLTETTYKVPLTPKIAAKSIPLGEALSRYKGILYLKDSDPGPVMGAVGVLVNGVPVFGVGSPCVTVPCEKDGAPSDMVDAVESEGDTTDFCAGHASMQGQYHVHSGLGFSTNEGRVKCKLPEDTAGNHSELLGWMFDGYGLYGINSLGGVPPDDVDSCHGHSHKINGTDTYHYHLPNATFPWTIGCYKGCPEVSNNPPQLKVSEGSEYGCGGGEEPTSQAARAGAQVMLWVLLIFVALLAI